jgi:peptidoglycan/LPS O-acetylase OafA/YrhL
VLRHNAALDGIRGLAIVFVLARHLITVNASTNTPVYNFARGLHDALFCGVDVFFALSGFLITRILINTVSDPHYFRSFYARRSLRIFPLYYGVVLGLLICTPLLHIQWAGQQWRLLTYSNRIFESRHAGWSFYLNPRVSLVNFWSLHIEEQFYMLWPLFVFFIRSPRRLLTFAASTSVVALLIRVWMEAHGFSQPFIYTSLLSRMDGLLIGACLAIALQTRFHEFVLKVATPVFLLAATLFAVDFSMQEWPSTSHLPWLFPLEFTLLALASSGLIAMCLKPRSRAARVFRNPVLRFFGKYSYGLYVFHSILPTFGFAVVRDYLLDHVHPAIAANLLNTTLELSLTIFLSVLSFYCFESPFLKLKRFFKADIPATQPAPAAA